MGDSFVQGRLVTAMFPHPTRWFGLEPSGKTRKENHDPQEMDRRRAGAVNAGEKIDQETPRERVHSDKAHGLDLLRNPYFQRVAVNNPHNHS